MRTLAMVVVLVLASLPVRSALAHPPSIVAGPGERVIAEEVLDYRKRMTAAIRQRDATTLRTMYAEHFQHVHSTGKAEGRDARIAAARAGTALIETVEPLELTVRAHAGGWVALVFGRSRIGAKIDARRQTVRWTAVYVRTETAWQLAGSQETSEPDAKP